MSGLAVGLVLVFWSLQAIEPGALRTTGPCALVRQLVYIGLLFHLCRARPFDLLPELAVPAQTPVSLREEVALEAR